VAWRASTFARATIPPGRAMHRYRVVIIAPATVWAWLAAMAARAKNLAAQSIALVPPWWRFGVLFVFHAAI